MNVSEEIMLNKKLIQAANFAAEKHKAQRRKDADKTPYINHPLALAHVLAVEGDVDDVDVIGGALLHDTVEDTASGIRRIDNTHCA